MIRYFICTIASLFLLTGNALSEFRYVLPETEGKLSDQDINIHFWGGVTQMKIIDLKTVIDKFNIDYPEARTINLYINSAGGDMDSGWAGRTAIKSSKIPVRTINLALTNSSATMLYCASSQRYVVNGASFLLHPAAIITGNFEQYKPDELNRIVLRLQDMNEYFRKTYEECTNMKEGDIHQLLSTENQSRMVHDAESVKIGLASNIISVEYPAGASAYIYDAPENGIK